MLGTPATIASRSAPPKATDQSESLAELAGRLGMRSMDLEDWLPDRELIAQFPGRILFDRGVLPLSRDGQRVALAISNPYDFETPDQLTALTGFDIETVLSDSQQITRKLREVLGVGGGTVSDLVAQGGRDDGGHDDLEGGDDEAGTSAVIRLVNELLSDAVEQRASDIHLEPESELMTVRFRVDGLLRPQNVPTEVHRFRSSIVSRLKIMARLNIAEKRLPQDGRIKLTVKGREIDVRISIIPMLEGEGVVMRLLDKSRGLVDLSKIEFPQEIAQSWNRLIRRSHGLLLVTGPTGSGKTTTLYSSLTAIRDPATKIITVEDPVEYKLPGINQIQVQSKIDLTFAAGLRSILRHDPDVVLIGEIRDSETASSAIQASMTGHLVFSTLHTNDAVSALSRLVDLGIEPYLVASTVEGVLAQRLVRKLCVKCREPYTPTAQELSGDQQHLAGRMLYRPVGCRDCFGAGYLGRIAIFELMQIDRALRQLCTQKASTDLLKAQAQSTGMTTLRQSGLERVLAGQTSLEEVARVCASEDE
jgi:general secretion pathway protein E